MISVSVLRKPLSSSVAGNVAAFGTGGVSIDGCRVGTDKGVPFGKSSTSRAVFGTFGLPDPGSDGLNAGMGRFPANLILQHGEGCRLMGCKQVKEAFNNVDVTRTANKTSMCYGSFVTNSGTRPVTENGKETVADWDCRCGCPARLMDSQSGFIGGGNKGTVVSKGGGWFVQTVGVTITAYDSGGYASRFFKQVK